MRTAARVSAILGRSMGNQVTIETEGASAGRVGRENGLSAEDLEAGGARAERALRSLVEAHAAGKAGFLDLPLRGDDAGACIEAAEDIRGRCGTLVVAGMGGSALGARALLAALGDPAGDLLPPVPRPGAPRVVVLDTVDPAALVPLIDGLPPETTAWNFVSKSGKTLETLAAYGAVRPRLQAALGAAWRERVVVTTDPAEGPLREEAKRERLRTLEIPPDTGGRFSVLSAAGLFPAAAAGADVRAILRGAAGAAAGFVSADPAHNDAIRLALWLTLLAERRGRRHHVLVAYRRSLAPLAAWWQQLWAESLGKAGRGFDATAAEGPAAQHSLLQLWMEGPPDKAFVFLEAEDPGADRVIEAPGPPGAPWLARRTLGDALRALAAGTRAGLLAAGRPVLRTTIPAVGPEAVGALLQLWMTAAALAGPLIGVDPFGQPGVEEGKRNAAALLGREEDRERRGRVEGLLSRLPSER
jgi:glucose-6-phosphate isomerase